MPVRRLARAAGASAASAALILAVFATVASPVFGSSLHPLPREERQSSTTPGTRNSSEYGDGPGEYRPRANDEGISGSGEAAGATGGSAQGGARKLAIVVPVYEGDIDKSLASLSRWPTVCSAETLSSVDLVLYKAEAEEQNEGGSSPALALHRALDEAAGRCFANTKVVYANLDDEDNVYPRGPSVQFYKLYLDEGVRQHFTEYDALAIIEWDVLVARDISFQQLYHAAFDDETFWVKGSVVTGTTFHETAGFSDMWHVLGHINGNAIYKNNDPGFVEFVEYARARWEYDYPYDVALWATISDFPYSWPLWQRYASKFVTTSLIANVGFDYVDVNTLNAAIAGDTLFIHGSGVSRNIPRFRRLVRDPDESMVSCTDSCGSIASLPPGMSTVCDGSCEMESRFGGYLCGAGDSAKYGSSCRLCYTDQAAALKAETELRASDLSSNAAEARHVIMCDTKRPPAALDCDPKCALKIDAVCDHTCGSGRYGDYNCNWRNHGAKCRYCFNDLETALMTDEVAKLHGGRVIMCDTHEPPRNPAEDVAATAPVQAIPDRMRSKTDVQEAQRRQLHRRESSSGCSADCETAGIKEGRRCDVSCSRPTPLNGRSGCGCGSKNWGQNCRRCFIDFDFALESDNPDDPDSRAIMCDTLQPPSIYSRRHLSAQADKDGVARWSQMIPSNPSDDKLTTATTAAIAARTKPSQRWTKGAAKKAQRRQLHRRESSSGCSADCETAGIKEGRRCDVSCSRPTPLNGRSGCGCGSKNWGQNCRRCFIDFDFALESDNPDDPDSRAIMCDTLQPPSIYSRRHLSANTPQVEERTFSGAAGSTTRYSSGVTTSDSSGTANGDSWEGGAVDRGSSVILANPHLADIEDEQYERSAHSPFAHGLERADLCAFMGSNAELLGETAVTVRSILEFMPGMRIAIAVLPEDFLAFERTFEDMPHVHLSTSGNPAVSALMADRHCGKPAQLIYYLTPGTLLSRKFTSKDTHSPQGDLLVVYGDAPGADRKTLASAEATSMLLGFVSPVFTYGTDLMLPSFVNAELWSLIMDGGDDEESLDLVAEIEDFNAAEALAAFAYSRNFDGMWFVNPQQWVAQHLFTAASIWDIPLVKPRFSCAIPPGFDLEKLDLANELSRQLDALVSGGTCESGLLAIKPRSLR